MNSKVAMHKGIVMSLNALYESKNADYGDSFAQARKEVPYYTYGKLYDKFNRYKHLVKSGSEPKVEETIEDTLLDMANYCIMEVMERRMENTQFIKKADSEMIAPAKAFGEALTKAFETKNTKCESCNKETRLYAGANGKMLCADCWKKAQIETTR